MAKYLHGIHGPFAGRLGPLVASNWRGISYLKTRPVRKKPYTRNELGNQGKFGSTSRWLSPLTSFLRAGFKGDDPRKWGFNGAKSYLHAHALVEDENQKVIDPSKVLISQGNLPLAEGFEMHFDQETFQIIVHWNPALPQGRKGGSPAAGNDKLMLAVYNAEEGEVFGEPFGVSRRIGMDTAEVPPGLVATYHVYVAFVAADGSSRSNSLYLGAISVGKDEEGEEEEDLPREERKETMEAEAVTQSADSYTQRQPLTQRSPIKSGKTGSDSQKHRWQSSTYSSQLSNYTYTSTYVYEDREINRQDQEPDPQKQRTGHKKTTAWFPSGRHLNT